MLRLKQTSAEFNVYLYPESDGCNIDFTPFGEVNNYECVDENKDLADDDLTYVYSDATDVLYDTYELPDGEIPTGATINYVQIFARAKSYQYAQHIDGIYKIIITDNDCSNIYESNDKDLTTSYTTFNYTWTENPRTTTDWTLADMDNLEIGVECSSPTLGTWALTDTFRPNAIGSNTNIVDEVPHGSAHWSLVDEAIADDATTCVQCDDNTNWQVDTYNIPNHTADQTGEITKVTVFAKVYMGNVSYTGYSKIAIHINGSTYYGNQVTTPKGTWTIISYDWVLNPDDSAEWEWTDIDNLEIGIALKISDANGYQRCTQVYAVVYYNQDINPEIRTTQCYAKINYTSDSECTLQNPNEIEMNQTQVVNKINFWDGSREVYGIARGNKTMIMSGYEWDDEVAGIDADTRIECVKNMGKALGEIIVTVSGSGSKEWDGIYRLISFSWKKLFDAPKSYEWMLELEDMD